jgi:hypothetical protein
MPHDCHPELTVRELGGGTTEIQELTIAKHLVNA